MRGSLPCNDLLWTSMNYEHLWTIGSYWHFYGILRVGETTYVLFSHETRREHLETYTSDLFWEPFDCQSGYMLMLAFDSLYHSRPWVMLLLNVVQLLFSIFCLVQGTAFGPLDAITVNYLLGRQWNYLRCKSILPNPRDTLCACIFTQMLLLHINIRHESSKCVHTVRCEQHDSWLGQALLIKHPIPRSAFAGPIGRRHWWCVLCPGILELSASLFWRYARKVASQAVAVWYLPEAAKYPMSAS